MEARPGAEPGILHGGCGRCWSVDHTVPQVGCWGVKDRAERVRGYHKNPAEGTLAWTKWMHWRWWTGGSDSRSVSRRSWQDWPKVPE